MGHLLPVLLASSLFLSYAGTQASHLPVIYSRDINATAQLNATATARHGTNGNSACELYAVASGDTCYSVSLATNISYAQVLAWNPGIDSSCSNLAALRNSSSICISNPAGNYSLPSSPGALTGVTTPAHTSRPIPSPTVSGTTSYCGQYYLVGSGDDCSSVALGFGITEEDFVFLNPELDANCSNLELGYYYCVEAVGSISTYSGYITTTATSTAPFNQTSATPLSDTGDIWANYTSTGQAIPIASDTRVDCYEYVVVTNLTNNTAADCWALASIYQLSPEDFILWNPSLAQGEAADGSLPSSSTAEISSLASSIASAIVYGNATATATATAVISGNATSYVLTTSTNYCAYPCTLSANTSYCVALASPTSSNVTTSTVSTPSPVATGEASNCTQFYQVQSYDTCANILALFDLTIAQFYFMNPSVGSDCTGMDLNYYYCVSIWPNGAPPWTVDDTNVTSTVTGTGNISTSSATTSTTSTGTGVVTPIPIQTGMVFDCDKFYLVKPDDGCEAIATEYNVSLSDFYAWNPAVGDECYYLDVGDYVCVGVSGATLTTATPTTTTTTGTGVTTPTPTQSGMVDDCDKFYLVQSDDGCDSIASSEGISVSDFYAWNPEVGDDCTNLWLNYYVCVGVED